MVTINMPIPDTCSECRLSVRHFGKIYCPYIADRVGNEGKDSRCPLVDAEDRGDLISRQDALSCFHDWIDRHGDVHTADEMPEYQRIEQLPSAQPEPNCSENPNGSDIISRQAAIDALGEEPPVWYDGEDEIAERNQWRRDVNAIKAVPSVQSEIHFDEWCTDCKEYDHDKHCCHRFNKVIRRTVEELKAQPKTGKWISLDDFRGKYNENGYKCSECGEYSDYEENFCPNCGARMKEGD